MKAFFFDFTVSDGGATQGTVYLLERLSAFMEVESLDAYGCSNDYAQRIKSTSVPYRIMHPGATKFVIGSADNKLKRLLSIIRQLKDFLIILVMLRGCIKSGKPDVVWVNNEKSLFFVIVAGVFLRFKTVLYYRGEGLPNQIGQRFRLLMNYFVDGIIVHSKVAFNNLIKIGISSSQLTYVPNCIAFSPSISESNDLPEKKYFRLILPAARPVLEKGHMTALRAVNLLKGQGVDVEILFPGVLPHGGDESFINSLKMYAEANHLEDRVHYIGWRQNLMCDVLGCDLVVLPSHTEGFPRSIIEAMFLGVPVCATPVGGIPEAIIHDDTGLLFSVNDYIGLAECVLSLKNDPVEYSRIAENAKRFAGQYFSVESNTAGVLRVFSRIVASD